MQKKTSRRITLLLRSNTKLRRKNTTLEESAVFRLHPERELREGEEKRGGERLKEECEGGRSRSE